MHENTVIRDLGFKYVNFSIKSSSSECMEWIVINCFVWNEKLHIPFASTDAEFPCIIIWSV